MIDHDEATSIAEEWLSEKPINAPVDIACLASSYLSLKAEVEIGKQRLGPAGWELLAELKTLREETSKLKAENEKLRKAANTVCIEMKIRPFNPDSAVFENLTEALK